MHIDIHTRFITLLGDPLAQSFAARMQNRGYEAAGLNLVYFYTVTGQEHLGDIVNGLRYMPVAGFAVTKPNKVKVLEYLDELDPLCRKMGSSNTVVKLPDGRLKGYNTDGTGFYTALTEAGIDVTKERFFCFGSGGAGRAMCSVLAYHGAPKIWITDLFPESARSLVEDINKNFAPVAEMVPYEDFSKVGEATVVLNASGVGMGKSIGKTPLPPEFIQKDQFYFDACYNPARTRFLENAEKAGCRVMNGLTMSLYQGTAQVELWSGQKAPVEAMRRELEKILEEKKQQESRMESMMMENVKESSKAVQQKNSLNALIHWLDLHLEETFLVVMLVLIAGVTMLQVIVRKIPGMASLTWAEELCRFLWIWSVFLSLPYTIRTDSMLRVGVLKDLLPETLRKVLNLAVDGITLGCMGVLGLYGVEVVSVIGESHEISPAMQWPMAFVYSFMVLGFFLAALRAVQMLWFHVQHLQEPELSTLEQTLRDAADETALAQEGDD